MCWWNYFKSCQGCFATAERRQNLVFLCLHKNVNLFTICLVLFVIIYIFLIYQHFTYIFLGGVCLAWQCFKLSVCNGRRGNPLRCSNSPLEVLSQNVKQAATAAAQSQKRGWGADFRPVQGQKGEGEGGNSLKLSLPLRISV
jgi:hypothetical protein